MEQSTISIIIIAVALILYATEIIPIVVTSILATAAMILAGILTPAQAFSGFSSTTTLLAGAAMVLSIALSETGGTELISDRLKKLGTLSERAFYTLLCAISAVLSACLNSLSIILIMMAVVDAIVSRGDTRYTRKEAYMPIAIGASVGGAISLSGSSSVLAACSVYNQYVGYDAIGYFGPAILGIPATLGAVLFYATIGTKLSKKWFDFEETPAVVKTAERKEDHSRAKGKLKIAIGTFVVCACLWVFTDLNLALVGLLGCCVCFITGCVKPDDAFSQMSWSTLIILATTLGFANGVSASGADQVLANGLIKLCGPLSRSSFGMFLVILILAIFLTNIMSNTGAAVIIAPIAISIANSMGCDARLWVIAVGVGVNCAVATPIGCGCMTVLLPLGYRFKDFMKPGLAVCCFSTVLMGLTFLALS